MMDPLSAAIGLGGDLLSGEIGSSGAKAQREWEERMMNTQYQRTTADMEKAGLNPLMMYMKGGGPTGGIPTPPNVGAPMSEAVATAAKQAAIDIPMATSQMAKNAADTAVSQSQVGVNQATRDKIAADAITSMSQNQVNLARLNQIAAETGLTSDQRDQVKQAILELQARIALEKRQADLTAANARKSGTEADALQVLAPLINSAADGIRRLTNPDKDTRSWWQRQMDSTEKNPDDIRPQAYINRTRGRAGSSGVSSGGANSAMKAMIDSTLARQEP